MISDDRRESLGDEINDLVKGIYKLAASMADMERKLRMIKGALQRMVDSGIPVNLDLITVLIQALEE